MRRTAISAVPSAAAETMPSDSTRLAAESAGSGAAEGAAGLAPGEEGEGAEAAEAEAEAEEEARASARPAARATAAVVETARNPSNWKTKLKSTVEGPIAASASVPT